MKNNYWIVLGLLVVCGFWASCSDDNDESGTMKNELIKKTVSPLIVGEKIEFAYAMGCLEGTLKYAKVEVSIPGAEGTGFEPFSWKTEAAVNIPVRVAHECYTESTLSSAVLIDTVAATLRYFYVVPEEARGKKVSFSFSSENSTDKRATFKTQEYQVSGMDMKKSISMAATETGARYFSVEDMKAYTKEEVETGNLSSKIDFVYCYAAKKTVDGKQYDYKHAFISTAATSYFPDGFSIPSNWNKNSTIMDKKLYVWDGQLKNDVNNNMYVDDLDLKAQTFTNSVDYTLDIRTEGSVFLKTANGKYVAYIYINSVTDATATAVVGIKRLQIN